MTVWFWRIILDVWVSNWDREGEISYVLKERLKRKKELDEGMFPMDRTER